MSTKIHYGKKLTVEGDFLQVLEALKKFGEEEIRPHAKQVILHFISQLFFKATDKARYLNLASGGDGIFDEEAIFENIYDEMLERRSEILHQGKRDRQLDIEVSITLLPTETPGEFLVFPIADNSQMMEKLGELPGLVEYAYWNNTDQPDGITDEEWDARGRAWDKALGDDGIPALSGFSITLVPASDFPRVSLNAVKANPPSDECRLEYILDSEYRKWADIICEERGVRGISQIMETHAALKASPEWELRKAEILDLLAPLFAKKVMAKP